MDRADRFLCAAAYRCVLPIMDRFPIITSSIWQCRLLVAMVLFGYVFCSTNSNDLIHVHQGTGNWTKTFQLSASNLRAIAAQLGQQEMLTLNLVVTFSRRTSLFSLANTSKLKKGWAMQSALFANVWKIELLNAKIISTHKYSRFMNVEDLLL